MPDPASGFTPERDRKVIMLSCLMLVIVSMFIFALVRNRLVELKDVSGAYAQVAMTDTAAIRSEASELSDSELQTGPQQHLAKWLASSGTVVLMHDKKGRLIDVDNVNPALGCVYWLDSGLAVTAVKPAGPVCGPGEGIRFWGQIAETDVAKLEFSEEVAAQVQQRFGLQPQQRIAIFFASEIEAVDRDAVAGLHDESGFAAGPEAGSP